MQHNASDWAAPHDWSDAHAAPSSSAPSAGNLDSSADSEATPAGGSQGPQSRESQGRPYPSPSALAYRDELYREFLPQVFRNGNEYLCRVNFSDDGTEITHVTGRTKEACARNAVVYLAGSDWHRGEPL